MFIRVKRLRYLSRDKKEWVSEEALGTINTNHVLRFLQDNQHCRVIFHDASWVIENSYEEFDKLVRTGDTETARLLYTKNE